MAAARVVVGDDRVARSDAQGTQSISEDGWIRKGVPPGRPEAVGIRKVPVQIDVDGARDMSGIVGCPPNARLAEHPTHVDDAEPRVADVGMERGDGPEGHEGSMHRRAGAASFVGRC